jgi:hypothetical protein
MDWREMEESALRREAKAEAFRELFGEAERPTSLGQRTGRMVISPPRMRPFPQEDGKRDLADLVDSLWEKGLI